MIARRALQFALIAVVMSGVRPAAEPQRAVDAPAAAQRQAATERAGRHFERIRHDPPALRAFLRAMPKGADLHTHLTGAVYAESYIRWAAEMPMCVDLATFGFVEGTASGSLTDPSRDTRVTCRDSGSQRPVSDALQDPILYRSIIDAHSTRFWDASRKPGHYQFFDAFRHFGPAAREGRNASTQFIARAVAEVTERAARQNVHHLELMMAFGGAGALPTGLKVTSGEEAAFEGARQHLLAGGLHDRLTERRQWLDRVEADRLSLLRCGTDDAAQACAVSVRYMPYALRGLPAEGVFTQALFAFELAAADPRIAGVNLVMPEDGFISMRDYALHMRMYAYLRKQHPAVRVSLHAGELILGLVPPETLGVHVRQAIAVAGAHRIGHATDVMYDADPAGLLREMASRRIAVEVSLSSSDLILGVRGARHPLNQFLRAGVPVVIATDDEGVARSDLTNEYQRAVEEQGLDYAALKRISRNSIEYSFLPDGEKAGTMSRLDAAFARFEARIR